MSGIVKIVNVEKEGNANMYTINVRVHVENGSVTNPAVWVEYVEGPGDHITVNGQEVTSKVPYIYHLAGSANECTYYNVKLNIVLPHGKYGKYRINIVSGYIEYSEIRVPGQPPFRLVPTDSREIVLTYEKPISRTSPPPSTPRSTPHASPTSSPDMKIEEINYTSHGNMINLTVKTHVTSGEIYRPYVAIYYISGPADKVTINGLSVGKESPYNFVFKVVGYGPYSTCSRFSTMFNIVLPYDEYGSYIFKIECGYEKLTHSPEQPGQPFQLVPLDSRYIRITYSSGRKKPSPSIRRSRPAKSTVPKTSKSPSPPSPTYIPPSESPPPPSPPESPPPSMAPPSSSPYVPPTSPITYHRGHHLHISPIMIGGALAIFGIMLLLASKRR